MDVSIAPTYGTLADMASAVAQRASPLSGGGTPQAGTVLQGPDQAVVVTISDAARAAAAAATGGAAPSAKTSYDQSFFDRLDGLQGQDKLAAYTAAALQVSADQGLPAGQFDLHHMTRGQALVVATYLKLTGDDAANGMLEALDKVLGAGTDFNAQTFDLSQLIRDASAQDPTDQADYNAALGLIDHLENLWTAEGSGVDTFVTAGIEAADTSGATLSSGNDAQSTDAPSQQA